MRAKHYSKHKDMRGRSRYLQGYTFHKDADTEAIAVCKPGSTAAVYWINLLSTGCDCPDRLKSGIACKHEYAYNLLQAEKADTANMWDRICKQWEDQNLPLIPELPTLTLTFTVLDVLQALYKRIVIDMKRAKTVMAQRDIQCHAILYDRQKRVQDLRGAWSVIGSYMTKEWGNCLDLLPAE